MKILIIEDEERSFMRLRRLLLQIDETLDIEGPITSVGETIEVLRNAENIAAHGNGSRSYDIIFADIRLDDGDVFEAFLQVTPKMPVIFTTAYNEYALEAFRSNGIAYLQKPIVPQELAEAVGKARKLTATEQPSNDYSNLLASLGLTKPNYREHFLVHKSDGYTVLNVQDINHISTENGIARAFLHNGKSKALGLTLNEIETQLDPAKFFRANRQYIIGIDSIESINYLFASKLSISLKAYPDVRVIVSKEKSARLKEWIDRYARALPNRRL